MTSSSELIKTKVGKAQVLFDTGNFLQCCVELVSAISDSMPDMQLFLDQIAGPTHMVMYQNILTSCTHTLSIDYQILKMALLLGDDQTANQPEDRFDLLEKAFQGLYSILIVLGTMEERGLTRFKAAPALTLPQFYCFSSIFFGRLTDETHALRSAEKALASLKPEEPGRKQIEDSISLFSSHHGICAVCRDAGTGLACAGCGVLTYCSPACQKSHWNNKHKEQCPILKTFCARFLPE